MSDVSGKNSTRVNIKLMPIYDNDAAKASYISVKLTLGGLCRGLQGGRPLDEAKAIYYFHDTVTESYVENIATRFDNIQAHDDFGLLTVSVEHGSSQSHSLVWKTDRLIQGDVTICYDAIPIEEEDDAFTSSIHALRRDHDGLVGIAASFMPIPAVKEPITVDVTIDWDISQAPEGIRTLSTFGEGNISQKAISPKALSECVFMVGRINSFPTTAPHDEAQDGEGFRGIHWLDTLPDNICAMREFTSNMLPRLSTFFKDDAASYQVFMRKVPRGFRATPITGGTLIDYDDDAKEEHDWDLVRLFNSSMIATWAHLDPEDDGTPNDWFTQGCISLTLILNPPLIASTYKQPQEYPTSTQSISLTASASVLQITSAPL